MYLSAFNNQYRFFVWIVGKLRAFEKKNKKEKKKFPILPKIFFTK